MSSLLTLLAAIQFAHIAGAFVPPVRCAGGSSAAAASPPLGGGSASRRRGGDVLMEHGSFFPKGASRTELKQRFKELAADLHPDRMGSDAPDHAVEDFKRLSAEYKAALASCGSNDERELLHKAWMSLVRHTASTSGLVPARPTPCALSVPPTEHA